MSTGIDYFPTPLVPSSGLDVCQDCGGTGADREKTQALRKRECDQKVFVRCWTCCGNGLDPTQFYHWGSRL